MKDLLIGDNGDLVISNGDCQYVKGVNLIVQKIRLILGTNQGEWSLNPEEGIDFKAILVKNPNYDQILDTVRDGIHQVDNGIQITSYDFSLKNRHLVMNFTASLPPDETEVSFTFGEIPSTSDEDSWLIRALADLVEVNC